MLLLHLIPTCRFDSNKSMSISTYLFFLSVSFIGLSRETSKTTLIRSEFWPIDRILHSNLMANSSNVILEVLIWWTRAIPSVVIALSSGTSSTGGISASSLRRIAMMQLQEEIWRYIFEKRSLLLSLDITLVLILQGVFFFFFDGVKRHSVVSFK